MPSREASSLIITGVVDGPLGVGIYPRAVELFATADILDLSAYQIATYYDGDPTPFDVESLDCWASSCWRILLFDKATLVNLTLFLALRQTNVHVELGPVVMMCISCSLRMALLWMSTVWWVWMALGSHGTIRMAGPTAMLGQVLKFI